LPRWARHVAIRAKHTTISFFGGYHQLAVWTIQEKQTRICRHHMRALTLASWTGHGAITLNHLDTSIHRAKNFESVILVITLVCKGLFCIYIVYAAITDLPTVKLIVS